MWGLLRLSIATNKFAMSGVFFIKLNFILKQLRAGKIKIILKGIVDKFYSEKVSFVLRRDAKKENKPPRVLIKLSFRIFKKEDEKYFFNDYENIALIKQLPYCYVAITEEDIPCFRIWLLDYHQNKKIKKYWGDSYPQLKPDEVLMESAYTTAKYRGLGIMPNAMALLSEKINQKGVRFVISVTPITNINSLKASYYAGFRPFKLKIEKHFLFYKSVFFKDIPDHVINNYILINKRKRG